MEFVTSGKRYMLVHRTVEEKSYSFLAIFFVLVLDECLSAGSLTLFF